MDWKCIGLCRWGTATKVGLMVLRPLWSFMVGRGSFHPFSDNTFFIKILWQSGSSHTHTVKVKIPCPSWNYIGNWQSIIVLMKGMRIKETIRLTTFSPPCGSGFDGNKMHNSWQKYTLTKLEIIQFSNTLQVVVTKKMHSNKHIYKHKLEVSIYKPQVH